MSRKCQGHGKSLTPLVRIMSNRWNTIDHDLQKWYGARFDKKVLDNQWPTCYAAKWKWLSLSKRCCDLPSAILLNNICVWHPVCNIHVSWTATARIVSHDGKVLLRLLHRILGSFGLPRARVYYILVVCPKLNPCSMSCLSCVAENHLERCFLLLATRLDNAA